MSKREIEKIFAAHGFVSAVDWITRNIHDKAEREQAWRRLQRLQKSQGRPAVKGRRRDRYRIVEE